MITHHQDGYEAATEAAKQRVESISPERLVMITALFEKAYKKAEDIISNYRDPLDW